MRKKTFGLFIIIFGFTLILAACGSKSQEQVTEKLSKTVEDLTSYKASAEMKMNIGQEDQTYDIDIWHKQGDFYRVELGSSEDEQESQIILKNEDGVFVLTPELNKSFKFQTDWPHNSSQAYLYHSLVEDVLKDPEATFEATDDYYVFQAEANYQSNHNMPYQEVYFDKKDYTPIKVKVLDKDQNPVVEVTFTDFELNADIGEDEFEVEENMANAQSDIPVIGDEDENGEEGEEGVEDEEGNEDGVEDDEGVENDGEEGVGDDEDEEIDEDIDERAFEVLFPLETFDAELTDKQEVETEEGKRILMVFSGDKNFTLVQEKPTIYPTATAPYEVKGDIVNLGFTVGAMTDNIIEWSHNGVDFMLASDELTEEELIRVAQSVQGREAK